MLAPPLAAVLFPFALEGFHTSVTHIVASGASTLSWLSAAACLALAFAMLIAMLAAMHSSEIGRPTVAQLRAKRRPCLPLRRQFACRPH
jgi:predicted benzoate:H+ symporter BenE